jgi:hypothetical protein
MLLILALMVVAVSIIMAAIPGRRYEPPKPESAEVGTAPRGWLTE